MGFNSAFKGLNEGDYQRRLAFAEQMLEIIEELEDAIIMMSDEAHFHLNDSVNKQNFRYWAAQNPHEVHERPLHSLKVTVWCAIGKVGVIGPYFFFCGKWDYYDCKLSSVHRYDEQFLGTRTTEPKD